MTLFLPLYNSPCHASRILSDRTEEDSAALDGKGVTPVELMPSISDGLEKHKDRTGRGRGALRQQFLQPTEGEGECSGEE